MHQKHSVELLPMVKKTVYYLVEEDEVANLSNYWPLQLQQRQQPRHEQHATPIEALTGMDDGLQLLQYED